MQQLCPPESIVLVVSLFFQILVALEQFLGERAGRSSNIFLADSSETQEMLAIPAGKCSQCCNGYQKWRNCKALEKEAPGGHASLSSATTKSCSSSFVGI